MTRTLMLTVFPASAVWPQLAGSSVVGTLTDPSGLPLLGVSVHCRHQNTGHLRETGTNEQGDFTLSSLDPGPYTLTFSAPGFKTKQLQDVVVVTGAKLPVGQVLLELGAVTEKPYFQLRASAFNTFNHTQFSAINTAAVFNPATGQQTNSKLGAFTAAGDPRQMQLGLRLVF